MLRLKIVQEPFPIHGETQPQVQRLTLPGAGCGMYAVTATDSKGCTATSTAVEVKCPPVILAVSLAPVNIKCASVSPGSITISHGVGTPTTGWGNPKYAWSGGLQPVPNPTVVAPNIYTVTVTDDGGCTITATAEVQARQPSHSARPLLKMSAASVQAMAPSASLLQVAQALLMK